MTFAYAVIADGAVVLCADSQVTHTHRDHLGNVVGTYEGRRGKIVRLGGRFAFSIAGNAGLADTLLADVDQRRAEEIESFEEVVEAYRSAFDRVLKKHYPDPEQRLRAAGYGVAFLFCGFIRSNGRKRPQVVVLDIRNDFAQSPITDRGYASTGAIDHGAALYLHHRFYRDAMPLEQAKLLAYCIAAEVADLDNSVGGPIEMEIVTPEGTGPIANLEKYDRARRDLIGNVSSYLAGFR